MTERPKEFVELKPSLGETLPGFIELAQILEGAPPSEVQQTRRRFAADVSSRASQSALLAAGLVLCDLAAQRWRVVATDVGARVQRPLFLKTDVELERELTRHQELLKRNEQLATPAVRTFVESMERTRRMSGSASIYSLMRDGRELAAALERVRQLPAASREAVLATVIDPYLQVVEPSERCSQTGLRLQDVWRYFRHTWTNHYVTTPGRSMPFLVRDRAAQHHPVIGIGQLSSPVVQIEQRDAWIGWCPKALLSATRANPRNEVARWLVAQVDAAFGEIFIEDFLEEGLLTRHDLRHPTAELIEKLRDSAKVYRDHHHRNRASQEFKLRADGDAHWEERARTELFKSKRALALADLLEARLDLRRHFGEEPSASELQALLDTKDGRRIFKRIVRMVKATRVGIAIAEISVCGAVDPYRSLLGGKLICMLAVSPELAQAYRDRYSNAASEIASAMAGRAVIRVPNLVFIGTTSLYGSHSSQYNRVQIPAEILGGAQGTAIRYERLGRSVSFGTSQFADDTIAALTSVVQQSAAGRRVNSIFGEGVSPKLRKVREGLEAVGLPARDLLQHGRQRLVYGISLVNNLQDYLLGVTDEPDYVVSMEDTHRSTSAIAAFWRRRWLQRRIESDAVLDSVRAHATFHPMRHGARVVLPRPLSDDETDNASPLLVDL